MNRALLVFFALLLPSGAGPVLHAGAGQRGDRSNVRIAPDAGVYAALLNPSIERGRTAAIIVSDTAITFPAPSPGAVPEWLSQFAAVPAELRDALQRSPVATVPFFRAGLFPAEVRVVRAATIQGVFAGAGPDAWPSFRDRFKANGWYAFSTVIATGDGLDALVYEETHCGDLCGGGAYVWLHRASATARWAVRRRIVSWVS